MPELRQSSFNEVPGGGISAPGEPHMACALLLDTSGSMYGNNGLPGLICLSLGLYLSERNTGVFKETKRKEAI